MQIKMIDMAKFRKYLLAVLAALLFLPLAAQEKIDTVYTFRFVPDKDMFYVPYSGNDIGTGTPGNVHP